ncbi:MAG: M18 family aminopeptidase [Candidatus Cloacimonetes bacterium HGW-Cloacimonetes-1]|jgi:aspartyl aminopeptidase|nr:MAG: M18 family aminopeptidase [Candidatus Cloacimonetes bacterium HGW-Cloacimonetes-1]
MTNNIKDLLAYLDNSPTSYQAAEQTISSLARAGFEELKEDSAFCIEKGGKYYVCRSDSAVIAFVMGEIDPHETGFNLAAAHLDSPLFKIKPETVKTVQGITRVGVEVYGGPIISTWLDRELSIAGKVIVRNGFVTGEKYKSILVNIPRPLAIIPNAAIHMNREINKGFEYNKQMHLQAILSTSSTAENPLKQLIADELGVLVENVSEMDLYLYDSQKAGVVGIDQDMISSGRLDDLAMSHAILMALQSRERVGATAVGVFYDNEEIGSQTIQGAMGSFLGDVLERICLGRGLGKEQYLMALKKSFLISADMAHAFHPGYAEKHDPAYAPQMNAGPVIKINGNFRYATTSETMVRFIQLCQDTNTPYQKFMTRSDMPCGSTIGPIASSQLGINTIDIGNPMWAMHSIRETCGIKDHEALITVLQQYWQ